MNVLQDHLIALYGDDVGKAAFESLRDLITRYTARRPPARATELSQRDAILITYGDQVRSQDEPPLRTLGQFAERYLRGVVSGIHLLPFYPYSSDDGFSVIDYRAVNPALGDWHAVEEIGENFRLMFDAVLNHVSVSSEWFRRFRQDDPRYRDFFIVVPEGADVSRVIRPRALPLLTPFMTPSGEKNVWTTFSADQVDLNYHNPDVLLEMVDTLLFYVSHRAQFIRLDAIAYLWKEYGTTCLHLPPTHRIIRLLRAVLDEVAPEVMLITETNVPHDDNITYFGDGTNEAQMVYNFALPPLVLHAFHTGRARTLAEWASRLALPSDRTTFLNFLASHDGIGLNPVRGLLSDAEIDALVERTLAHGGRVSYKNNLDGTASPYELNINFFDALSAPKTDEAMEVQVARFVASQSIMLSLTGVPGIYFHSLFGSRGWSEGVQMSGSNRTINREKLALAELESDLADTASRRHAVFTHYAHLLRVRASHPAFHPCGEMRVLDAGPSVLALQRTSPDGNERLLCLQNVSSEPQPVPSGLVRVFENPRAPARDLVTGAFLDPAAPLQLSPYQTLWAAP